MSAYCPAPIVRATISDHFDLCIYTPPISSLPRSQISFMGCLFFQHCLFFFRLGITQTNKWTAFLDQPFIRTVYIMKVHFSLDARFDVCDINMIYMHGCCFYMSALIRDEDSSCWSQFWYGCKDIWSSSFTPLALERPVCTTINWLMCPYGNISVKLAHSVYRLNMGFLIISRAMSGLNIWYICFCLVSYIYIYIGTMVYI